MSDGLTCFSAEPAWVHPHAVRRRQPQTKRSAQFAWVNTVLGNFKTTLARAFHSLKYARYADSYLAALAYRFNRRFDLRGLVARLIVDVTRCSPAKESIVRATAEAGF